MTAGDYPRIEGLFLNANMMCNYLNVSVMLALLMGRLGWLSARRLRTALAALGVAVWSTLSPGIGGAALRRRLGLAGG